LRQRGRKIPRKYPRRTEGWRCSLKYGMRFPVVISYRKEGRTCQQTSGLASRHQEERDDPKWPVFPLFEACRDRLPDKTRVHFKTSHHMCVGKNRPDTLFHHEGNAQCRDQPRALRSNNLAKETIRVRVRERISSMLTGMRTVFIPASLRLFTSSWVNHVDLERYHEKRHKTQDGRLYQWAANFSSTSSG
jgi:hypothetical protein